MDDKRYLNDIHLRLERGLMQINATKQPPAKSWWV